MVPFLVNLWSISILIDEVECGGVVANLAGGSQAAIQNN
jgi:hypothetical protein